ncbi:MAG: Gfo/Idh/MocA family oxidoreductase [Planctomycetes bacterium]|nr:Gfo/Idh/MocA family oxidoreductase [Planctomycetota bacterium]
MSEHDRNAANRPLPPTRRTFVGGCALGLAAAPLRLPRWAPHRELRVAVVGVRGRGRDHIGGFLRLDGVRIAALVDVDAAPLAEQAKKLAEKGVEVDAYADVRRVLDRDDIDAISVATPNHWHALQAIWACQAGKDVYLEKPVSHNVFEGGQVVAAARKYGRIVQTGTQCRSSHGIAEGIAFAQSGKLGQITLARGLCYKPRQSIGKVEGPQQPPQSVDYDLWCGPAPKGPLRRKHLHYDWHWDFATGNGDVGNQGIHQMDIARWALGRSTLPTRTLSIGGRVGYDDDGDTPNTQIVYHEFGEGAPLLFEVRGLPRSKEAQQKDWGKSMDDYLGARIGVIVHCERGYLRIPDYSRAIAFDQDDQEVARFEGATDHFQNFVDAVRSRKVEDLHADIREGHLSSAMCHMGNVSHLLGEVADHDALQAAARANAHLADAFLRLDMHLRANEVDLSAGGVRLGRWLRMDPQTEHFVGDADAEQLRTRVYREGFEVPEQI